MVVDAHLLFRKVCRIFALHSLQQGNVNLFEPGQQFGCIDGPVLKPLKIKLPVCEEK